MIKSIFKISLLLLFIITGCTLESKFGLPKKDKIDNDLLGTWTTPCIINQDSDTLKIKALDDFNYQLVFDTNEVLKAYSLKIKEYNIINIISTTGSNNLFYGYEVEKDTLRFYEVNPELLKGEITSEKELNDFFIENIDKDNFFMNACIMVKPSN
ncbi:hypothetical protein EV195_104220 [Tenacibaculum skagerrakense]|uniref:Lipocalin-like protein n=1 Tax=Tenacibaculum skagerrakense TaxID=186571 RepID=A0A4R2NTK0_9FLAO|nr:hypothetical protein [Tenacibaculum skagerrakense]TCP25187.1 hypothetical protein EV195_104220 [Tenacibaculum skagerrakense]